MFIPPSLMMSITTISSHALDTIVQTVTVDPIIGDFIPASYYSAQCTAALKSLSSNPEVVACLNPSVLLPIIFSDAHGEKNSLITPIDNWLQGMCTSQACSNDTLALITKNLTTGCSVEFSLPLDQASQNVAKVQKYYPTVRKPEADLVLVIQSGNARCVTSELGLVQNAVGTLNFNQSNVDKVIYLGRAGFNRNIVCTDCTHGALTIVNQDLPGVIPRNSITQATSACGASFLDGSIPFGLVQTAVGVVNSTAPAATVSKAPSTTIGQPPSLTTTSYTGKKSSALSKPSTSISLVFATILLGTFLAGSA